MSYLFQVYIIVIWYLYIFWNDPYTSSHAFSLSDFILHSLTVINVSITAFMKPVSLANLQAEGDFGDPWHRANSKNYYKCIYGFSFKWSTHKSTEVT